MATSYLHRPLLRAQHYNCHSQLRDHNGRGIRAPPLEGAVVAQRPRVRVRSASSSCASSRGVLNLCRETPCSLFEADLSQSTAGSSMASRSTREKHTVTRPIACVYLITTRLSKDRDRKVRNHLANGGSCDRGNLTTFPTFPTPLLSEPFPLSLSPCHHPQEKEAKPTTTTPFNLTRRLGLSNRGRLKTCKDAQLRLRQRSCNKADLRLLLHAVPATSSRRTYLTCPWRESLTCAQLALSPPRTSGHTLVPTEVMPARLKEGLCNSR